MSKPILLALRIAITASLAAIATFTAHPANAETVSADNVTVRDGPGQPHSLAGLIAGRPTILHFWATWCAPCREELPKLDAFAEELQANAPAGHLVTLSVDTKPHDRVAAFLEEVGAEHLANWQIASGNAGSAFRLFGYPATLLVRPDGSVAERLSGPVEWDDPNVRDRFEAFLRAE